MATQHLQQLAIFGLPGGAEWIVVLVLALLLFGRRLPDVARSVGKSIVEFKRGLHDVKGELDKASELPEKSDSPSPDHSHQQSEAAPESNNK